MLLSVDATTPLRCPYCCSGYCCEEDAMVVAAGGHDHSLLLSGSEIECHAAIKSTIQFSQNSL